MGLRDSCNSTKLQTKYTIYDANHFYYSSYIVVLFKYNFRTNQMFKIFIFKILILFSYFLSSVLLILRLSEKLQVSQTLKSE